MFKFGLPTIISKSLNLNPVLNIFFPPKTLNEELFFVTATTPNSYQAVLVPVDSQHLVLEPPTSVGNRTTTEAR
jgi:hypothetical protein